MLANFIHLWIKFFFLLTPFFALTVFLVLTADIDRQQRQKIAVKTTITVIISTLSLYFFGDILFRLFGITIDAFRVGAGCVLFLTAIELVSGKRSMLKVDTTTDISVVPMAIPVMVGPGTIGAIMVSGVSEVAKMSNLVSCASLIAAALSVGTLLFLADHVVRIVGKTGLEVLSKISGLVLSAMAAQIIMTGVKNFLYT